MSGAIKIAIILVLLVAVVLAGYYFFSRTKTRAPEELEPRATAPTAELPAAPPVTPPADSPEKSPEATPAAPVVIPEDLPEEPLPEGSALLEKAASAVGSGEPLTFDFTTKVSVLTAQGNHDSLVEGKIILGKENQGMLHLKNEQMEIQIYNSGEKCILYSLSDNSYMNIPAAASRRELIATMMTGILELPAAWLADMFEGKAPVAESLSVSPGNYAGAPCWELNADIPLYMQKVYLAKEEPHTPVSIIMDLKEESFRRYRIPPKSTVTITTEFMNWQLWYVLPDNTFEFTPPPEAVEIQPDQQGPQSALREGSPAPDFTLEQLDGGTVQLKDYLGKNIIILDFWATWCGPCRRVIPLVTEVAHKFADQGVLLFAVNQRETPEKIRAFLQSQKLTVPVLLDKTGQAGMLYQVVGIPKVVIIGKDGLIKTIYGGMIPDMSNVMIEQIQGML